MRTLKTWAVAAGLVALTGAAQATPVFQGRLADGTASSTCTVSGATKCTSFYDSNLNVTILNNWNLFRGDWSAIAAQGSAQALVESAGFAATGLTGWVLPTGDGSSAAGALNQYLSIWLDVGSSLAGLQGQFDGVQTTNYWSGSAYAPTPGIAWYFFSTTGGQITTNDANKMWAVAVLPGDVAASVPEPQTLALALLALGATLVVRSRRPA
jgi:hypothetical protein